MHKFNLLWYRPRSIQFIEDLVQVLTWYEEKPCTSPKLVWCRPCLVQFIEDRVHVLT